jgi:putative oxidoreductase
MAQDIGKLLLRLTLAVLMLFHGAAKVTGNIEFLRRMMEGHGLPAWTAYSIYLPEILAPLLLIAGWYSRAAGAVIALQMLYIFVLVHSGEILKRSGSGGWALEVEGFFLMTAIVVMLIGPGKYALNRR